MCQEEILISYNNKLTIVTTTKNIVIWLALTNQNIVNA
jgi:hypothetical protein